MRASLFLWCWAAIVLGGCSYIHGTVLTTNDGHSFHPVAEGNVMLFAAGAVTPPFDVVGPVAAMAEARDMPDAFAELQRVAAEKGADIVVDVKIDAISVNACVYGLAGRRKSGTSDVAK